MTKPFLAVALGVVLASGAVLAHHGGNLYDTTKAVELKATITKFEWGTPHNQIYFDVKTETLATLRDIPITRAVTNAALTAYRELAHRQPLLHRSVKLPDVLIAAAAAEAGVGVLHYDADYDTLATVLRFESRWIARRGSLA